MCYYWDPAVLWLNVISDSLIAAAYYAIPVLVFYFVTRRRDISFKGVYIAVGIFILACGTTHLMGAVTVWNPIYRLDGVIKAITALASLATFAMLVPMMPMLISLPSPAQMARANLSLAREIQERRAAEEQVRRINEELGDARGQAHRRASGAGGSAPPLAEDGGGRTLGGRSGARFQQSADGDPGIHRNAARACPQGCRGPGICGRGRCTRRSEPRH